MKAAALAATLSALLLAPAAAFANRAQLTMMEDSTQLLARTPEARDATLDEFKALGTDIVKIRVEWRDIAPDGESRRRPDFDAADPDAYPGWGPLDEAVRGVVARGMQPFLMVGPPSPEWATERPSLKGHPGVWKTDPDQFRLFMRAIGRRYDGRFGGLPRVGVWSVWNEANHPQFIQPLSEKLGTRMTPSSPHQYRRLYTAAVEGLTETGHGSDRILFGELLPIGQRRYGTLNTLRPIEWLREFYCVDKRFRPYRGSAARARGCEAFPEIRTAGFAYHPYTRPIGIRFKVPHADDATIGQIARIERALDRIARTRRVKRGLAIYSTEFGIQTEPPDCVGFGTPLDRQGAILNEAEYISWTRRRVKTYSQYLLQDDTIRPDLEPGTNERYGGFQTGLMFGPNAVLCESPDVVLPVGRAKQPGYDAFRTPLWVETRRAGVRVFGRARPQGRTPTQIEILRNGRRVRTVTARGYFLTTIRGASSGRWELRWAQGVTTIRSRTAKAAPPFPAKYR